MSTIPQPHLPFRTAGTVVPGFKRGSRDLGFPTANLDTGTIAKLPLDFRNGVYYGYARVDAGPVHQMVMSVGFNPQFNNKTKSLEIHIIHTFPEDFYGHRLDVLAIGYIRPMSVFTTLKDLIDAIRKDIDVAKQELAQPYNQLHLNEFTGLKNGLKPSQD